MGSKHQNCYLLNMIGYGLAKFDDAFVNEFDCRSKAEFFALMISTGVGATVGTIKNRQDLFDPFFDNGRSGWWQKGNTYLHRKLLLDSLFGDMIVSEYANTVKLYLTDLYQLTGLPAQPSPITSSKFKKLQETGLEAELYFLNSYNSIHEFEGGVIEDARLLGDGYDFQIRANQSYFLVEVKGVRAKTGDIRLTENEYRKADEYKEDYVLAVISNLDQVPKITCFRNPVSLLHLQAKELIQRQLYYISPSLTW